MLTATPFLLFDGECAEAMSFYQSCIGGELTITRLGDTPMKEAFPLETHDRTINARLISGSIDVSASDWMAADFAPVRGNMSAIYVNGSTLDELDPIFTALKDGDNSTRVQELHQLPFGIYGQLYDRFGVQWIVGQPEAAD
jgi:PhnB protein